MIVFVNDTDNDEICRFPITSLGLHFHNTVDTLKYFTKGSRIRIVARSEKGAWCSPKF